MELQAYELFVPKCIDDIIKNKQDNKKYKIIDILHTYSAEKKTIVDVQLRLLNLETNNEEMCTYKNDMWEVINE